MSYVPAAMYLPDAYCICIPTTRVDVHTGPGLTYMVEKKRETVESSSTLFLNHCSGSVVKG